jgi:hypothetical protein
MDQVLKKAMEKRDEALREVERWESWMKVYVELADPLEIPIARTAVPRTSPGDELDIPFALRPSDAPAEGGGGKGLLPRSGIAN